MKSIIAEEGVFGELHIPQKIVARDNHIQQIENCLLPLKENKSTKNVYVFGPPGSGKTVSVRHVLKKHFDQSHVYVNCWRNRTSHKIMDTLLRKLGFMVHGRESTSELVKKLEKSKKNFIVCLDEVDQLKDSNVLYDLAKYSKGLVLISNQPYSDFQLDQRIKSRLFLYDIEFGPYKNEDVLTILKDRTRDGLHAGTVNDEVLSEASVFCGGDVRMALQMLRSAAREAELKDENSVTVDFLRSAARTSRKYRLSYLLGKLNDHQRILYDVLKRNRKMNSGKLFEEYCKRSTETMTDRTYRNYMQRMVELGLVREKSSGRWKKYEIVS